ncbi:T9SS type A sorting domain-containing protein [Dyadobacter sp. CY351]|uniref:T9SS type A sorting domain-containing protein n=1 Tax=Dyadobacter sp. CY351 TaxID=2909337 RepID=UPI0038D36E61
MVKQEGSTIGIYPNPAQNQLTVSGLRDRKHVFIYNQKGAIVSEQVTDVKGNLNTGGLPNGIYNVRINNQTKKLLIQK